MYRHLIETTSLELNFTDESSAFTQNSELGPLFEKRLSVVIDEVFTGFATKKLQPGEVFTIEKIELDLGVIAYEHLHDELEIRLRARLSEAINGEFGANRGIGVVAPTASMKGSADFEQLTYFLRYGCLPWNGNSYAKTTVEDMVKKVVSSGASLFYDYLKGLSNPADVVSRLVRQLSDRLLSEMVATLFFSADGDDVELLHLLESKQKQAASSTTFMEGGRERVWSYIFNELLGGSVTAQNWRTFVAMLDAGIDRLYALHRVGDKKERSAIGIEPLTSRLATAIQMGDSREFEALWPALIKDYPVELRKLLFKYGHGEHGWELLSQKFPVPLLYEICRFYSPASIDCIGVLYSAVADAEQQQQIVSSSTFWSFTLAYLTRSSDGYFNKDSYIKSLLTKLASNSRSSVADVASLISKQFENSQPTNRSDDKSELLAILAELNGSAILTSNDIHHSDLEKLKEWLIGFVGGKETAGDEYNWQILMNNHREVMVTVLKNSLYQASIRKSFSKRVSDNIFSKLINLVAADISPFLEIVEKNFHLLAAGIGRHSHSVAHELFREFTVACFFTEGEISVSQHRYIEQLLHMLAQHDDRSYAALLKTAISALQKDKMDGGRVDGLLDMVNELLCRCDEVEIPISRFSYGRQLRCVAGSLFVTASDGRRVKRPIRYYRPVNLGSSGSPLWQQQKNSSSSQSANSGAQQGGAAVGGAGYYSSPSVLHEPEYSSELRKPSDGSGIAAADEQTAADSNQNFAQLPSVESLAGQEGKVTSGMDVSNPVIDEPLLGSHRRSKEHLVVGYGVDAKLRQLLLGVDGRRESYNGELTAQIRSLAIDHPTLFLRLYRELQSGEMNGIQLLARLSSAELKEMIHAILMVTCPPESDHSDFIQALELFSQRAINHKKYYRDVVESLVNGSIVDFEQLAASSLMEEGVSDAEKQVGTDISVAPNVAGNGEATARIKSLVMDHPTLFQSLYRALQRDEMNGDQLLARLSSAELKEMIHSMLMVTCPPQSDHSDFMHAMELFSQRAINHKKYYRDVVESLVNNSHVDFEQLAAASAMEQSITDSEKQVGSDIGIAPDVAVKGGATLLAEFKALLVSEYGFKTGRSSRLIAVVEALLKKQPRQLRATLLTELLRLDVGKQLSELLPERLLGQILLLLQRSSCESILSLSEVITIAFYNIKPALPPSRLRQLMWQFIFKFLFFEGRIFQERVFIREYVAYLATEFTGMERRDFCAALLQMLALNIASREPQRYQTIVTTVNSQFDDRVIKPARLESVYDEKSRGDIHEEGEVKEDIYISNAGQVLAAPYLPRLFEMLGLMDGSVFKNSAAAERGVHLMQYLVDEQCDAPEYQLVLNKILCGVKTGTPIVRSITTSESERAVIDGLLQGMIQNWNAVGNTSVSGLRQSFLQREGRLQRSENGWHLLVQPRAYDMLLDQLPWSFSLIRQPWMERVLHVEWR